MKQQKPTILIKLKKGAIQPFYGSKEASGADICALIYQEVVLDPRETCLIPTGVFLEIPTGYEVQIRPRSGLALKHGITVLNTPGTIDADYRGEIGVILINHGKESFTVTPNMRIAQIVLAPVEQATFQSVTELSETQRASGGFGHTGLEPVPHIG